MISFDTNLVVYAANTAAPEPRVSPFLFVDGHVKFYDCSYKYTDTPTFPGEVEFEQ